MVLARIDKAEQSDPTNRYTREYAAASRKYAVQVYAHPTWTAEEAWAYGEQERLRRTQEAPQPNSAVVQATCRFQGRFAEELVQRRDIERVTRTEALANFDRALQSPYGTEQDKATIAIYRQLAVQVYAHRAWTLEDARTYGEQECLRSNTR